MKKRILSIVLTLCMVLMLLPQAVFAANDDATDLQNKLNSGGTVTSEFNTNTNAVAIKCTSNTLTAFTGKISGYTHLYGGIYYGTIDATVTIEAKKITFQNGNNTYAYEIVDSGNNTVAPISPSVMTGYQAFDGWYNGSTKYTFGSSLSQDIILTAKYKNLLTYNITYNLDSGTATNPATYTVESDAITLNNPVKTGYTFTGWSGTGLTGENNMTVTIPKGSTGNRAYTAHFSQNSYTVVFDTVGGSSISDKTGVKWTDQVLDGITAPTKDGWEFTGWKCGDMTVNANTKYSNLAAKSTASLTARTIILKRFLQRLQPLPKPETRSIGIAWIAANTLPTKKAQTKLSLMTR